MNRTERETNEMRIERKMNRSKCEPNDVGVCAGNFSIRSRRKRCAESDCTQSAVRFFRFPSGFTSSVGGKPA